MRKRNGRCSKCNKKRDVASKRYCKECAASYMRMWRKTHPLSEEQRIKSIVRSTTNMAIERGILIPDTCWYCDDKKVEAHHEDYSKPYKIKWLCKFHHREHHKKLTD